MHSTICKLYVLSSFMQISLLTLATLVSQRALVTVQGAPPLCAANTATRLYTTVY